MRAQGTRQTRGRRKQHFRPAIPAATIRAEFPTLHSKPPEKVWSDDLSLDSFRHASRFEELLYLTPMLTRGRLTIATRRCPHHRRHHRRPRTCRHRPHPRLRTESNSGLGTTMASGEIYCAVKGLADIHSCGPPGGRGEKSRTSYGNKRRAQSADKISASS